MARVVIAAGGTAGHVVPALAVADALRDRGHEVSFIGTRERAEADLVPAAGYEIDHVSVRGIDRRNPVKAMRAVMLAARAVGAARRHLRDRRADCVLGGGGYVAGTAGLAAVREGTPLVLTEADSHLGLANRLLARRAHRVCLAFPIPGRDGPRYLVTGRPVPAAIVAADRAAARGRFGIEPEARCVLVFGGSLGARSVNRAAVSGFGEAGGERPYWVLHVTGRRDHREVSERCEAAGCARYVVREYEPNMADSLAAADLVVARSGGSVFEVAAAGRPAVLVPYPHATADHQRTNAEWMESAGAAVVLDDEGLDGAALRSTVEEILGDPARLDRMAAASRRIARPDAASTVASEVEEAISVAGR